MDILITLFAEKNSGMGNTCSRPGPVRSRPARRGAPVPCHARLTRFRCGRSAAASPLLMRVVFSLLTWRRCTFHFGIFVAVRFIIVDFRGTVFVQARTHAGPQLVYVIRVVRDAGNHTIVFLLFFDERPSKPIALLRA